MCVYVVKMSVCVCVCTCVCVCVRVCGREGRGERGGRREEGALFFGRRGRRGFFFCWGEEGCFVLERGARGGKEAFLVGGGEGRGGGGAFLVESGRWWGGREEERGFFWLGRSGVVVGGCVCVREEGGERFFFRVDGRRVRGRRGFCVCGRREGGGVVRGGAFFFGRGRRGSVEEGERGRGDVFLV